MNFQKRNVYLGGCHCGRVRFKVTIPDFVAIDCNCSICQKKEFLHVIVPQADFQLVQGEADLLTYRFNTGQAKHHFCRHCGIHSFYYPRSHPGGVDVNLRCLDGNLLHQFEIGIFDGKNWEDNIHKIT